MQIWIISSILRIRILANLIPIIFIALIIFPAIFSYTPVSRNHEITLQ